MIHALRSCFGRAARYRFLSLLLRPPAPGRREALAELAAETSWPDGLDPAPLTEADDEAVEVEAFRVLGPAGAVSVLSSDYVGGGYADKGPILADIAGFYRAFGFEPALAETPDHFSGIFEFLSFLALKQTWALMEGDPDQARLAGEAEESLIVDHVNGRLARFSERLGDLAPAGGAYERVARFVAGNAGSLRAPVTREASR